jgi:poly-gamma-glutamate capsule biosynthesis protein CapA/YwtB (metallophosphatase superfamily)
MQVMHRFSFRVGTFNLIAMKTCFLFFIILFFHLSTRAQLEEPKVRLLFLGDVMGHLPQAQAAYDKSTKTYNYDSCFKYVKPWFQKADLVIGNLEVTLAGPPYSGYPQFSAPDALALGLKDAGVDVLVTANNHCCDRDLKGLTRTIKVLDSLEIKHTGTFVSKKEKQETEPMIITKNGIRMAFLSYTYSTNGRKIPAGTAVNLIDTLQMAKDIAKSKSQALDEIIVFIHWGNEYQLEPSPQQRKIESFLHRQGIRVIIGSHPHVIEPIEAILDKNMDISKLTVFSLGNFVSNQRKRYTDGGLMFYLELSKEKEPVVIENPGYIPTWVLLRKGAGLATYQVLPVVDFESKKDFFLPSEWEKFDLFRKDARQLLDSLNLNVPEKKGFKDNSGVSWEPPVLKK